MRNSLVRDMKRGRRNGIGVGFSRYQRRGVATREAQLRARSLHSRCKLRDALWLISGVPHHKHHRILGNHRHRDEIRHRVVGQLLVEEGIDRLRRHASDEDGVAVRRCPSNLLRGDQAICARFVLDDHRLTGSASDVVGRRTGGLVGAASRGEGHNELNGACRVVNCLRIRQGSQQNQTTSEKRAT